MDEQSTTSQQGAVEADSLQSNAAEEQHNQEALEASAAEAQAETAELDVIPEKFVGKSPLDIIKAYNNAERQLSKVSSERAEERKKREDLERRISQLESQPVAQPQQVSQQSQQSPETDPFADYDKQFDADPKEAIKSLVAQSREYARRERELAVMQLEAQKAAEYYNEQKRSNPEYEKLEPTMQKLAQEYGALVDPRQVNSVKALKLLHLAARGAKLDDFVSEAASKAKKETSTLKQEKRAAFSESSGSTGGGAGKAFKDLPVTEMEKLLGISRD